jgi:NADH:ubiquinone oxidoreductase subunit K
MTLVGLLLCLPLLFGGMVILQNDWNSLAIVALALVSPSWVVGVALLLAVYSSLAEEKIRDA